MAFKMKGHTLPGIKQKASAKAADDRAKSSAFQAASVSDFKDMGKTMQDASPKEEPSNLEMAGQMLGGASPMQKDEETQLREGGKTYTVSFGEEEQKNQDKINAYKKKKEQEYRERANFLKKEMKN
tara:strand:- start:7 stop:384 length:378 start_codon:yes stop_codon:yes gene_type:complete